MVDKIGIGPTPLHRSRMKGLTLIELVIVIAIIGVVIILAGVNIEWWRRESRLTELRDMLMADIEDVKIRSVTALPHAIFLYTDRYERRSLNDANSNFRRDAGETTNLLPASDGTDDNDVDLPTNIKLGRTGGDELWFDRKGIPRTATWALGMTTLTLWYDKDGDGLVDTDEQQKELTISSAGRIQYEK